LVQTPQTFRSEILLPAYEATYMADFTDEASVVEFTGERVHLIDGEQQNIKITGPMDLLVAREYLRTLKS
jgi:2-C-methyl-D-erythritol 4-phosphate cytidylyltransferase